MGRKDCWNVCTKSAISVSAVTKAETRGALGLAMKRLDERIVSLVVQFEAAAGGDRAVHCSPGAWTCCEPKRSKDQLQSEQIACMWECVPRADSCTGFLGSAYPAALKLMSITPSVIFPKVATNLPCDLGAPLARIICRISDEIRSDVSLLMWGGCRH